MTNGREVISAGVVEGALDACCAGTTAPSLGLIVHVTESGEPFNDYPNPIRAFRHGVGLLKIGFREALAASQLDPVPAGRVKTLDDVISAAAN